MLFKKSLIAISLFFVFASKPFAQVTLQTGSAVFSLPMFNWHDDKCSLNSMIGLNYSSGNGLKVNDIASNEGQGWNLVAGGVITRMQVGEPDDQPAYPGTALYGSGSDQDITKYPAGFLYHTIDPSIGCPNTLLTYPTYGAKNVLYTQKQITAEDKQLDYFAFQFNGKSGMFILDTTGGNHGIPLGDTKLKISFQLDPSMISSGIRTTITSFTITDVDGLIYKFTYHGLTKLLKSIFSNEDGSQIRTQPTIKNNNVYCQGSFDLGPTSGPWANQYMANPYIIGNWYLSEVDDPFTSRKIIFSYHSLNLSLSAGQDISYNNSLNKYVVISYKKSVTKTLELDSINYPDGHVAVFNYATSPRVDYPGEYALSKVSILYNDNGTRRYLSQYQLGTTYFILNRYGTPTTTYQKSVARLCLKSIKKISVDLKEDSPPYIFDYYTSTGSNTTDDFVPPPFFYAKDIWGYYNGNNSKASDNTTNIPLNVSVPYYLGFSALKGLCFQIDNVTGTNYNAKSGYAQNGLLKEIIYPTGGSLTYQYAQNTGSLLTATGSGPAMTVGGVHVSQTSSSDGGYSNGCGNPIITHYDYVMNGAGSASSLWGLETPLNSITSNNYWQEEKSTIHFSFSNFFGTCKWHYVYPGILSQYEAVSLDGFQKFMNAVAPVLGILSVISTINDIANVIGASTGVGAIVAVIIDVITTVLGYILGCTKQTKYTPNIVYYDFDLNQMAPLPAQFKRVEVTESSGTNGKTVQLFTHGDIAASGDPQYYPLWFPGPNLALSSKQRFAPWAYGLPYLTTVYDVNGNKIKETQNNYNFNNAQRRIVEPINGVLCYTHDFPVPVVSCKCQVVNNKAQRSDWWTSASPTYSNTSLSNGDMNVDVYNFYSGRAELSNTLERTYKITDVTQFVQTETDYYYNSADCDVLTNYSAQNNYEVNEIGTVQSNGDANHKYIKYTTDFNSGIFSTMIQKNIVSTPVSTISTVFKAGGSTSQYLNEKVTEFSQLSNGNVKPSRIIEQRFANPQSSLTPYSGPLTTNYANYKIPQVFTYDANSNLIGVKDEGNRTVANIYDYNDKYVVASVINADPGLDLPAYTSFETSVLGGWILTGPPTYSTTNFITGSRGFILNSCTLRANISTAKPYLLSFWANNASVTVTGGATLSKTGPTYLGMTYYEYNIAQGTSSVALTGNSNIDELRIYPATARMRTTTYDPLIGKTSECDENNRITYYTYDNLARLQFIKDETGNIVKAYEYNTVSAAKQTGCPVSYSNHLVSELISRNCSAGYRGSGVTYTVAAGTYTSTISQFDADMKAELYLLTNGQNYANANGSCSLIYYNTIQSQTDTTQTCNPGYKGGLVTYTVPDSTYNSIISQTDANQQALDDIAANAQSYANAVVNMSACVVDTAADWEWFAGDSLNVADPSYCLSVNGQLPPHQFLLATDVNPNSPTYNQTHYYDYGPTNACAANTYFNAQQSQSFTRNNCTGGTSGTSVIYTVPPGKYSSTSSQAAADLLATNDMNANGQNYANAHGLCCLQTFTYSSSISSYVTYNISLSGATVNFTFVFAYPTGSSNFTLGTINGSCDYPTSVRTIPMYVGTTLFNLIINPSGSVQVQLVSGPIPTGNMGFSSNYDINTNAFYSASKSGTFTRNNCLTGQVGSSVTYTVQAYRYSSLISQAAADQLAQNDVNSNGQNYANSNGTCSTPCSFTWASGLNGENSTVSSTGTTGSLQAVFYPTSNNYSGGTIGTIVGSCKPSVTRYVTVVDGATPSRTWSVTISSTGSVSISLVSGSQGTTSGPPIVINVSYSM